MRLLRVSRRGRRKNYEPEQTQIRVSTFKTTPRGVVNSPFFLRRLTNSNSLSRPRVATPCRHARACDAHQSKAEKQMRRGRRGARERAPDVLKRHARRIRRGEEAVEVTNDVLGHGANGLSRTHRQRGPLRALGEALPVHKNVGGLH